MGCCWAGVRCGDEEMNAQTNDGCMYVCNVTSEKKKKQQQEYCRHLFFLAR